MSNRVILVTVGTLFSIYCLTFAILTFIGLNFATFHLSSFWLAGFAAIYGVLSPIGLSGILGGLHRKKSLVKGFMFQYWFATGLLIGINVANILLSDELRQGAIQKCQSALFGVVSNGQDSLLSCTDKVRRSESIALILTSVQGGVLISFGLLVLFFGIKEFKDITLEEETKNLLEKAKFQEGPRNSLSDIESNISGSNNNSNTTISADNVRYNTSTSVSRASSRSDQGRYAQSAVSTNVSRASSRSDRERFAQKVNNVPASYAVNRSLVNQNNVNQNRTPGLSSPYSTPANNASTNRINATTQRVMPPGQYQSPPGNYQPTPPKNNYIPPSKNNYPSSSNKNNYPSSSNRNNFPSSSNKNNYQLSTNKNNYLPPSNKSNYPPMPSNNNYPPLSKSNSSPINGSSRPPNSKINNYSSQPLPLENYPIISPERSYAVDRYGPQASNPLSYSSPLINYAGKSKPSVGQSTIQPPPSNRNYRQPAMMNGKPPLTNVSASRPQQKIQKGYQAGGNDYDYANDYNDYIIPSNTYMALTKPR